MHKSVWSEVTLPQFESLSGEHKTDVLVIGGGICGVLCAYFLHQAGVDCTLVEAERIASGITQNTTAKITTQQGLIYAKLCRQRGTEQARRFLMANQRALARYEVLAKTIPCDFEPKPAYTYSLNSRRKIEDEVRAVQALGGAATFEERTELPLPVKGAICVPNQAQFHPLKFMAGLLEGLRIYEQTRVTQITPDRIYTDDGIIRAQKVIVTTHFPFINKHGSYFLKLYQHRSYVTAYQQAPALSGMYVDEDLKGLSFRSYGDLLLLGGGGHRTGKQGGAWTEPDEFMHAHCKTATPRYRWAAQDCMSLDGIPYIGPYSKQTPDWFVATGFNKWGMISSMVAAELLCAQVQGKRTDYDAVFSPSRSILKPQLAINGAETTLNLLTPTKPRCPHLGCALKWNPHEHSWDCPCHGSRFSADGSLIDNPATGDAKTKKAKQ